jgi:hypothetical protein
MYRNTSYLPSFQLGEISISGEKKAYTAELKETCAYYNKTSKLEN